MFKNCNNKMENNDDFLSQKIKFHKSFTKLKQKWPLM